MFCDVEMIPWNTTVMFAELSLLSLHMIAAGL